MFEWLFKQKDGSVQDLVEVITQDLTKLELSKFAISKAINIIGNAIAKSDIRLQGSGGIINDELAYRLNVQPNDNETGTEFWKHVVFHLVTEKECVIAPVSNKFYIVESYNLNDKVLKPLTYSNITIKCAGKLLALNKTFKAGDIIHIRMDDGDGKLQYYLSKVMKMYDQTVTNINAAISISSVPKFKMELQGGMKYAEVQSDGSTRMLTKDQYTNKLKKLLEDSGIQILATGSGTNLTPITISTSAKAEELAKYAKEIFDACAMAFDIPSAVFYGTITEKSDAGNEFITYSVSPYAEAINDALNVALVGMDDWIKGERAGVWLGRFEHADVLTTSHNQSELRAIGWTLDEIREMVGYYPLNTEFSTTRALTLNYDASEGTESGKKGGNEE